MPDIVVIVLRIINLFFVLLKFSRMNHYTITGKGNIKDAEIRFWALNVVSFIVLSEYLYGY